MSHKSTKVADRDPALVALHRAARKARELAIATGTPFYVVRRGKLIDLARRVPTAKQKSVARN